MRWREDLFPGILDLYLWLAYDVASRSRLSGHGGSPISEDPTARWLPRKVNSGCERHFR